MTKRTVSAIGLAALLLLAACAPARGDLAASPTRAAEPMSQPGGPASPVGVDTSLAARPDDPVLAVLIDDDGSGQRLRARPIDPKTLADVPGYLPITFGHHYIARVSPDGRTIAAILWPSDSSTGGARIHLIDTERWIDRELETPITNYTTAIRFDQRGTSVYWTQPKESELTPSVFALDVATGRVREVVRLSQGFYARDMVAFGAKVAVFLMPANVSLHGAVQQQRDVPRIALVDTGSRHVTEVRLPVRAGSYPDSTAAAEEPFRSVEPGLAWDLARTKLYIADADTDRVFVMDLRNGNIAGPFDPKPKRSMLDVLWSLFGSVAEAKMTSTSRQHAAIAPDGSRLYVTGLRSDFAKGTDGKYHESVAPLQLRVIDTSDMSELARVDGATTPLWMSPDGATLLYGDNRYDTSVEGYASRSGFRIHVVDSAQPGDNVALSLDGEPFVVGFTAKSRTAYVRIQHFPGFASLSLIDLASRRVVVERVLDRHFADVLLLGSP